MDNPYYERLINAAIRFVSFRPRSEHELRAFLLKKPHHEDIDKVMLRMRELGYADDEKFATWWVQQRTAFRPKGNRVITMELRGKGVEDSVIASVLASRGSESLLAAARQAIVRKLPLWSKLPSMARRKKIYDYLARRGFDGSTIGKLIDAGWD